MNFLLSKLYHLSFPRKRESIDFLIVLFLFTLFLSVPVFAAPTATPKSTAEHFQFSLTGLKESMLKLEQGNDKLREENGRIQISVAELQKNFDQLQGEGKKWENNLQGFLDKAQQKAQKQDQLKKDLDAVTEQLNAINPGYQEKQQRIEQLQKELAAFDAPEAPAQQQPRPIESNPPPAAPKDNARLEKLKLLKMILESKQRQQKIQGEIFDVKKNSSRTVDLASQLKGRQEFLQKKKEMLNKELTDLSAPEPAPTPQPQEDITEDQIQQVAREIESLHKKYDKLLALNKGSPKRGKKNGRDDSKTAEASRLESSVAALKKENQILRQQVKGLRVEMVNLDKKKNKQEQRKKSGR